MVLADVFKRWQELKGRRAILCTGTDEHGMKVQRAAEKARTDPKAFCDKGAEIFKVCQQGSAKRYNAEALHQDLAAEAGISNDHFVRTTDTDHQEAVQYAWVSIADQ